MSLIAQTHKPLYSPLVNVKSVPIKHISIGKVKPLIKLLAAKGIPPLQLMNSTGIQLSELAIFNTKITHDQYFKLIDNACQLAPSETFSLHLGEQFYINHDGILACRIMSCKNAFQAMSLLTEYQSLLTQLFHLNFQEDDSFGVFTAIPSMDTQHSLPYFIEYIFASIYSFGKFCTGSPTFPLRYEFTYDCGNKRAFYEHFFGSNIHFNCEQNRVLIPTDILNLPFIFESKKNALENDKFCQDKLRIVNQKSSILEQVEALIIANPFSDISLILVAEKLCMSPRTLRRHLNAEQVSYKDLLEKERKRVVTQALNQNTPIKKVAEQLGYQDTSSFSRAFKKWFGVPPHLYKNSHHI